MKLDYKYSGILITKTVLSLEISRCFMYKVLLNAFHLLELEAETGHQHN